MGSFSGSGRGSESSLKDFGRTARQPNIGIGSNKGTENFSQTAGELDGAAATTGTLRLLSYLLRWPNINPGPEQPVRNGKHDRPDEDSDQAKSDKTADDPGEHEEAAANPRRAG